MQTFTHADALCDLYQLILKPGVVHHFHTMSRRHFTPFILSSLTASVINIVRLIGISGFL